MQITIEKQATFVVPRRTAEGFLVTVEKAAQLVREHFLDEDDRVVSVHQEAILDRDDPEAFEYVVRVRVGNLAEF